MKKKISIITMVLVIALVLSGCGHEHSWVEANCNTPRTCSECGETEGTAVGHKWVEATCAAPKTCSVCGATEGEALAHTWRPATCDTPMTCSICGVTSGKALDHSWKDATCTEPKACAVCGLTEGEALGHVASDVSCTEDGICSRCGELILAWGHEWIDATCVEPQTCSRCGETQGEALGHSWAELVRENEVAATCTEDGEYEEVVYCSLCHEELERTLFTEGALGHTTNNGVCSRCGNEVYETVYGNGDDVITDISVGNDLYKVYFTNSGSRNFVVWVYDATGDRDLAVNEIGRYEGYYLLQGTAPYTFEIESSGKWSYTIEKLGNTDETAFSGTGCYVTDKFTSSSGKWHITHQGDSNFVVWLLTTDGRDLIVNEIGDYDGNRLLSIPTGSLAVLIVEADGKWSITPA